MKTSRQRLLDYVQAHPGVTSHDLSRALKMTEANARHHLSILREDGLVGVVGRQEAKGKGRPAYLYGPAEQALGHNLDRLSSLLLDELGREPDSEASKGVMRRLARRLAEGGNAGEKQAGSSLTQRLYQTIQRLNEMHYQARWEAHAAGPRLILGHCPYADILQEHPELCQMDGLLLEQLVEAPVRQIAKMTHVGRGVPYCVFRIK